jgi:hypothetical protein
MRPGLVWSSLMSGTHNDYQFTDDRVRFMATLKELVTVFEPLTNRESETPTANPESDRGGIARETTDSSQKSAATLDIPQKIPTSRPAEQHSSNENPKQKSRGFDYSKLDHAKFDALVHRLVNARYHELSGRAEPVNAPSYMIIGWFSKGSSDPHEKFLTLKDEETLFSQLRKGARSVRGWREYLSLKTLCRFGLYKVSIPLLIFSN